jgi:hypothetical protein
MSRGEMLVSHRRLTPSLYCDACQTKIDVLSWTRHNKTKDHLRKQEIFDEKRQTTNQIRRLQREVELRKSATPEEEIQSILEEEDFKEQEEYDQKVSEAIFLEKEAIARKKSEDEERDKYIKSKLDAEKEVRKKEELRLEKLKLIYEARDLIKAWEERVYELLENDTSPKSDLWDELTVTHPNKYTSNFTDFIKGVLWDDAWNYKMLLTNMVIDYTCPTHVPIYQKGTRF